MSSREKRLLVILASIIIIVLIGGGYYVLKDSGIIGGEATLSNFSTASSDEKDDTGVGLPVAWTATAFDLPDIDYTRWRLQLTDFPLGFEYSPDENGNNPLEVSSELDEIVKIKGFTFSKEGEIPQFIAGITWLIPNQRSKDEFDIAISSSEFISDDILSELDHNGILEESEISGLEGIGELSAGWRYLLDMEAVEMRVEIISFRRDIAGAMLFSLYIDDNPIEVSILDLARILDQRIIPTLPNSP